MWLGREFGSHNMVYYVSFTGIELISKIKFSHGFTLIAVIRSIDTSFYRHIFINLRHGFLIARLSQNPWNEVAHTVICQKYWEM